jgi:hypothetical protein
MGKRTDPEVLVSQVVRNLGELPWFPPFVLADPSLSWVDAGPASFEVRSQAAGRDVRVRFDINDEGDVVRAYSPARPYDVAGGFAEAPWSYDFHDHGRFSGVRIPATAVAAFEKGGEPQEYLRIRIRSIAFGST